MSGQTMPSWHVTSFDGVVRSLGDQRVSFTEAEALKASHWDMGEDARLREDLRFRLTLWGRWILSDRRIANDLLYRAFVEREWSEVDLEQQQQQLDITSSERHVFCTGDPRFVLRDGRLRLAASELDQRLLIEADVPEIAKFTTHLPVHSLAAAAACEPAGEWGPQAHEEAVETLGWVRTDLPGRHLNDRMFIARIVGDSLLSLHKHLGDSDPAVFEFWPVGDRKNLFLLVCGSFNDPDTGSYAVKKYVPEPRRQDRTRSKIRLVSANPDREKYPDIVVTDEDADSLAVVAKLLTELEPRFARRVRHRPPKGCRDLESNVAREGRFRRLEDARERYFAVPPQPADEECEKVPPDLLESWSSQLVMLSLDDGGLAIETSPLVGLPRFVKRIEVRSAGAVQVVLASNLRTKTWQFGVDPSFDPVVFVCCGFEEDLADDLARLTVEGLPADQAVAFRIDAFGVGRRLTGNVVSPGQRVRILIPPLLTIESVPSGYLNSLEHDWQVWDLAVPAEPVHDLRAILTSLGLRFGPSTTETTWVGTPPREYRRGFSGDRYPCFRPGDVPVLRIDGLKTTREGEVVLFVSGDSGSSDFRLPAGGPWVISFDDATVSRYLIDIVPLRRNQKPSRVAFAIDDLAGAIPGASAHLTVDGVAIPFDSEIVNVVDLTPREDGPEVTAGAPPLWTARASWQGWETFGPEQLVADDSGSVDIEALLIATELTRGNDRFGRLVVDFGELGCARAEHGRKLDGKRLADQLHSILEERSETIEQAEGRFDVLQKLWFGPLTRVLGYRLAPLNEDLISGAPAGCTALLLEEPDRTADTIVFRPSRLLVVTPPGQDFRVDGKGTARNFAARSCKEVGAQLVFFSDGFRWAHWKPGRRFMQSTVDLREVLTDPVATEDFLAAFLAEHER